MADQPTARPTPSPWFPALLGVSAVCTGLGSFFGLLSGQGSVLWTWARVAIVLYSVVAVIISAVLWRRIRTEHRDRRG